MGDKLWRVSRILGLSPFDPTLLGHTEAQLNWILERYAEEHPKELKIVRGDRVDEAQAEVLAKLRWDEVLTGPALAEWQASLMPSPEVLQILAAAFTPGGGTLVRNQKA